MVKFDLDFKIKVVTEYLSGCGFTTLMKRYGLGEENIIHIKENCWKDS